jgi:hypothetical protein
MSKRGRLIVDRSAEVTERRLLETALVALNRCSTNETQDEAYYALRDAEERIYDQGRAPRVNGFSFLEALDLAQGAVDPIGSGADPNPLADYVASDVPLTRNQRQLFAHFVRTLPTSLPHGYRGKGTHSMAARNETRISAGAGGQSCAEGVVRTASNSGRKAAPARPHCRDQSDNQGPGPQRQARCRGDAAAQERVAALESDTRVLTK